MLCFSVNAAETTAKNADVAFTDVNASDWFFDDVKKLSDGGILNGYPDGTFRPSEAVSRAEILKLITVTLNLEPSPDLLSNTDESVFSDAADTSAWFYPGVGAALSGGLIFAHEFNGDKLLPESSVSRSEAARLICRGLGFELIPYSSPFADTHDIYAVTLFASGIMQGSFDGGGQRVFEPDAPISRAECCAVISRIIELLQNKAEYLNNVRNSLGDKLAISQSPKTVEDFYLHLDRMFKEGIFSARFNYNDCSFGSDALDLIKKNYLSAFSAYYSAHPEYASLFVTRVSTSGNSLYGCLNVDLDTLQGAGASREQLFRLSGQAKNKAAEVLASVVAPGLTPRQKADAIHDYIVSNAAYDTSGKFKHSSYLSYGVLVESMGVCQGYAAAFNVMCELSGLYSFAVSDGAHMWNVVMLDGKPYIYDTTWDDPVPDIPLTFESKFRGIPLALADGDGTHKASLFDVRFVF